jgi:hypothetical protein
MSVRNSTERSTQHEPPQGPGKRLPSSRGNLWERMVYAPTTESTFAQKVAAGALSSLTEIELAPGKAFGSNDLQTELLAYEPTTTTSSVRRTVEEEKSMPQDKPPDPGKPSTGLRPDRPSLAVRLRNLQLALAAAAQGFKDGWRRTDESSEQRPERDSSGED